MLHGIYCLFLSGLTLSTTLVNAGLTTFEKILETNARELELIVNRHPPFGNQVSWSTHHFHYLITATLYSTCLFE